MAAVKRTNFVRVYRVLARAMATTDPNRVFRALSVAGQESWSSTPMVYRKIIHGRLTHR